MAKLGDIRITMDEDAKEALAKLAEAIAEFSASVDKFEETVRRANTVARGLVDQYANTYSQKRTQTGE